MLDLNIWGIGIMGSNLEGGLFDLQGGDGRRRTEYMVLILELVV